MMRGRMLVRVLAPLAVLAGALVVGPGQAGAAATCGFGEICLYSGTSQSGTKVAVPQRTSCRTVSSLGIPAARSAVDNHEFYVLILFSDTNCQTQADPEFVFTGGGVADTITPAAQSIRLLPIPAG